MVQEKLKRSSKQPRAAPETAAAVAQAAAAQAPRIRPGAFVPREPVQVPSPAGSSPMAVSPYGRPALSGSSGNEADGGVFGVQRQHSDAASAAAGAQQYQQYQRQAFTPPNALATPLPARPGSAFVPMSGPAAAVAPTPVPGMRPYTAPGEWSVQWVHGLLCMKPFNGWSAAVLSCPGPVSNGKLSRFEFS